MAFLCLECLRLDLLLKSIVRTVHKLITKHKVKTSTEIPQGQNPMISPSELFSFPETETGAEVTRVSLEGTANKANKDSSCNASKDGTRTIS